MADRGSGVDLDGAQRLRPSEAALVEIDDDVAFGFGAEGRRIAAEPRGSQRVQRLVQGGSGGDLAQLLQRHDIARAGGGGLVGRLTGAAAAPAEAERGQRGERQDGRSSVHCKLLRWIVPQDRKSTRLNSSHTVISYAVFC